MLGVLVAVLHLDVVAAEGRFARQRHVSLVVALRVGGPIAVISTLGRPVLPHPLRRGSVPPVARGAWPICSIVLVTDLIHTTQSPSQSPAGVRGPVITGHLPPLGRQAVA